METHLFRFNDTPVEVRMTMQDAILHARSKCLNNKKEVRLYAKTNRGRWTLLGTYVPFLHNGINFYKEIQPVTVLATPMI